MSILGFGEGSLLITYLGALLHAKRVSISGYSSLVDKFKGLINSWSARKLSYAGRLQLIKSVFSGILSFWSQVVMLPLGVIHQIEGLCRRFLWSGNMTGKKHFASW